MTPSPRPIVTKNTSAHRARQPKESMKTKKQAKPATKSAPGWKVGAPYLIRTVTMIQTGRLVAVTEHELVLTEAAWIADTGRFADALKGGSFLEVEPFPDGEVIVGRGAVIDACQVPFSLPRSQK